MKKVLIDTNLLVLLIAGELKPSLIGHHRRLRSFSTDDFSRLHRMVREYHVHVSTPNVLTEASNLLGAEDQQITQGAAEALFFYAAGLDEIYQPSRDIMREAAYTKLGLADATILQTALLNDVDVLTVEFPLHNILTSLGGTSLNLRHFIV